MVDVHVPLERDAERRLERLRDREVDRDPASDLDVRPRRVEVGVRGDHLTRVDHRAEEDALGAASLVGRDDEGEPEDFPTASWKRSKLCDPA